MPDTLPLPPAEEDAGEAPTRLPLRRPGSAPAASGALPGRGVTPAAPARPEPEEFGTFDDEEELVLAPTQAPTTDAEGKPVVFKDKDGKELPPLPAPATEENFEESQLEKAKRFVAKTKMKQRHKRLITLFVETPAVGIMAFLTAVLLQRFGLLPAFSFRGLVRLMHPPETIWNMIRVKPWTYAQHFYFYPVLFALVGTPFYAWIGTLPGKGQVTCKINKTRWDRNSFCRGWLVTGGTGCGKTASALMNLLHQVFINEAGKRAELNPEERAEAKAREDRNARVLAAWKAREKTERPARKLRNKELIRKWEEDVRDGRAKRSEPPDMEISEPPVESEDPTKVRYDIYPAGGVFMDEKGLFYPRLVKMVKRYNREHHLALLQTRPIWADATWKPKTRFNILSASHIPSNTFAKAVVTTGESIEGGGGGGGNSAYFKTQAQIQMGWAIEICRAISARQDEIMKMPRNLQFQPNLKRVALLLSAKDFYDEALRECHVMDLGEKVKDSKGKETAQDQPGLLQRGRNAPAKNWSPTLKKLVECLQHFERRYWALPKDTLGSIQGNINNYLNYFTSDDVAEVFCADNTVEFEDVDKGMLFCLAMPQTLAVERQYICTLLKLLFYQHVLRRFDKSEAEFKKRNLLVAWQDEAQRFATESDGNVDVIREASATTVMLTQSKIALFAPLGGEDKARVPLSNLRNRIIYKAADPKCAEGSADFIGKHRITKKNKSVGKGGASYSYSKEIAYRVEPFEFVDIPDLHAYVCHANGVKGKVKYQLIEPLDEQGNLPDWYERPVMKMIGGLFGLN